ncbi:MAG: Chromosomal replication initiator protein DnaA [Elusimicrobia bacterium ADurb.Bin231]|nr:MAG: Chromosomal replication initiator protein DnaA [Elusimicrobia bacterium ADurb.Bin231]
MADYNGIAQLNPKYTFDEFIVGANNNFVQAAAFAVARHPGKKYNPLFIYGGVGLGKTHIMHAIGNYIKVQNPLVKISYITTEKFISEVIEAVKNGNISEFRSHYRTLDLLLVDDVQFLSQGESIQEEFFHTFNILHDSGKQIVLTSDKPPKKLSGIEERLQSRFEWGLIADIKPADLETRIAILKKKANEDNIQVSEKLLLYIATNLKSNIRELEGFLKRLNVYSSMENTSINIELVQTLIGELMPDEKTEASAAAGSSPAAAGISVSQPSFIEEQPESGVSSSQSGQQESTPVPTQIASPGVTAPAETAVALQPKASDAIGNLRPVNAAFFYPEGCEKEFQKMKAQFREVILKNKFKFYLESVFEKDYCHTKKVNTFMLAELCKTNKVNIAIILLPPPNTASDENFENNLFEAFESNELSAEIIPYTDLNKQYKYLNILLDITMFIY